MRFLVSLSPWHVVVLGIETEIIWDFAFDTSSLGPGIYRFTSSGGIRMERKKSVEIRLPVHPGKSLPGNRATDTQPYRHCVPHLRVIVSTMQ